MTEQITSQKQIGTLIRKTRSVAIKLFTPIFIISIFLTIYAIIKTGVVPHLEKSPFYLYSIYFIIRLFTFDKKKLDTYVPWYKNEWLWDVLILILFAFFVVCMLLTV